jgi:hypothetical protein
MSRTIRTVLADSADRTPLKNGSRRDWKLRLLRTDQDSAHHDSHIEAEEDNAVVRMCNSTNRRARH